MLKTKSMLEESPKTIRVSFKTYKELIQLGTFGDSFDSIITGLLSNHEKLTAHQRGSRPGDPSENQQSQNHSTLDYPGKESNSHD